MYLTGEEYKEKSNYEKKTKKKQLNLTYCFKFYVESGICEVLYRCS